MRPLTVDHVGWAVHSIERALPSMSALGFEPSGEACRDDSRSVNIILLRNSDGDTVELIEPIADAKSPISNFLAKNGPSPYHCCFAAGRADLADVKAGLKAAKFAELICEAPAPALGGRGVIFYYSREVGLIEVVVRDR